MATTIEELQVRIGARISGLEKGLKEAEGKIQKFGQRLSSVGQSATRNVTLPLAAAGVAAVKFAGDFESSFANVRKTTDATESQFQALQKEFRGMAKEIPTGVNELNNLAGVAGQLGVESENLSQFTRTIAMLGDTTDISGEQAALSLSRFMNVMGTAQGDVDRLGSTIVGLGNNFAAMESEIINIGTSLASFGRGVGLSESDVLAFATTIAASGGQAEAASTAFQKTASNIQQAVIEGGAELNKFANVAGQSSDEFAKSFRTNAAGAIRDFLKGLDNVQKSGGSTAAVLEDLGLADQRLQREFGKVIGNLDDLDKALVQGNDEWKNNNALTEEAEKRYATFNSRIKVLWNNLYDLGITIGDLLIPYVESLAESIQGAVDWFQDLDGSSQKLILGLGAFAAAIGPVLTGIGFMATNIGAATKALGALRVAAMANPYILLGAAIAGVSLALYTMTQRATAAERATQAMVDVEKEAAKATAAERTEITKLLSVARNERISKEDRKAAIDELNKVVPTYRNQLSLETIDTNNAKRALDLYNESLVESARIKAANRKLEEVQEQRLELQVEGFEGQDLNLVEEYLAMFSGFQGADRMIQADRQKEDLAALDAIEQKLLDVINTGTRADRIRDEFEKLSTEIENGTVENLFRAEARLSELRVEAQSFGVDLDGVTGEAKDLNKELEKSVNITREGFISAPEMQTPKGIESIPQLGSGALTTGMELIPADLSENVAAAKAAMDQLDQSMAMINQQSIAFGGSFDAITAKIRAKETAMQSLIESGLGPAQPKIMELRNEVDLLTASLQRSMEVATGVGNAFGQAFQQAASESQNGMDAMVNGIREGVKAAIKAFLAQAIAAYIAANASTLGPFGIALGAAAPGIVGGIFDAAVPAFAKGGLVAGPTLGLIGEGPGTSASNPEVIAPLDKLKSMIGGVGQTIDVRMKDVRLEGQDLLLAFDRATDFRNRTT